MENTGFQFWSLMQINKMKKDLLTTLLSSYILVALSQTDNVGIGTTNPHESALVEFYSENKGILLPRLTTGQRDSIPNPALGLMIFNSSTICFDVFNGTNWIEFCNSSVSTSDSTFSEINRLFFTVNGF